jgi:predicted metal-dependent hydrolase
MADAPPIVVRDPLLDLSSVPRHWLAGSAAATGLANAVNMLFPLGERFFVRSVHAFKDVWAKDPMLAARVKAFSGQEGHHARAHDTWNDCLRAQGYQIDRFLAYYRTTMDVLDARMSPEQRLAATAAAEHFTAILAEGALSGDDDLFAGSDPRMAKLLGWHAVEEIEHKSVAFDVLRRVNPSYRLRMTGLAIASYQLGRYWAIGARVLWRQDGLTVRQALRELRQIGGRNQMLRRVFLGGIRDYMRRDFHPDQRDNYGLARAWLAAHADDVAA